MKRTILKKFLDVINLLEGYREVALSQEDDELVTRINTSIEDIKERMEATIKKNNGEKKPSIQSIENPKIAERLYEAMKKYTAYTATEIGKLGVEGIPTTSKATIILGILKKNGKVTKRKIKGHSFYYKS